jgi:hypothetical protein
MASRGPAYFVWGISELISRNFFIVIHDEMPRANLWRGEISIYKATFYDLTLNRNISIKIVCRTKRMGV